MLCYMKAAPRLAHLWCPAAHPPLVADACAPQVPAGNRRRAGARRRRPPGAPASPPSCAASQGFTILLQLPLTQVRQVQGTLAQVVTRNPVLYIDFPQGRLKFLGTLVFLKNKYLGLKFGPKEILCEDAFDSMVCPALLDNMWCVA